MPVQSSSFTAENESQNVKVTFTIDRCSLFLSLHTDFCVTFEPKKYRVNLHLFRSPFTFEVLVLAVCYFNLNGHEIPDLEFEFLHLQWNSVITNSVVNEQSAITNKFLRDIGHFNTQINPVITNPGYNEQKSPVPSCSL